MASSHRVPGLLRHRTGQGRVILNGKTYYLGPIDSPACHERYAALIREWVASGRKPLTKTPNVAEAVYRLRDLQRDFLLYLDQSGRYHKNGKPTSQRCFVHGALGDLTARFGEVRIIDFHEALLLQHRDDLEAKTPALARKTINRRLSAIKQTMRWGYMRRLVPREVFLGASALQPLQRHECAGRDKPRAKRAVTLDDVELVAKHASRQVAAMLRIQFATGMRPGEVCGLRWADIDRTPVEVGGRTYWVYTVPAAKTEHHGHVTRYVLGATAQAILKGFRKVDEQAFLFSPADAMAEWSAERRERRETPVTDCTRRRDAEAKNEFATSYGVDVYRRAVKRACERAKVRVFSPHELRHSFVTRAAEACGALAASVAVNHTRVSTTEGYLHADRSLAYQVVAKLEAAG